jgi:hypothetical protein
MDRTVLRFGPFPSSSPPQGRRHARPVNDHKADAFIARAVKRAPVQDESTRKAVVNMRFDTRLLARIDAATRQQGISRTAWLHVATSKALEA